ncbi:GDP-mannose 4,6-dehydratase [Bacteroides sp.]|uniref:GDP-mannose 4,6-dehydratase n=1 Tax=Bacteroides sp. TaxID=29523 RepID=UPI002582EDA7|nr:GDP-mannose 4,6-dehydratase [Bacteroides sp.]
MKKVLVTGAAGFIGFHTIISLIEKDCIVVGLDNINSYYDIKFKYSRLKELGINKDDIKYNQKIKSEKFSVFSFFLLDLEDKDNLPRIFEEERFDRVINLAAQAGVRYSITNPFSYIDSNLVGFANILECCRHNHIEHFIYASSSSVYGENKKVPFSEDDRVDNPVSLYAATKKANELMASTYAHLYKLPATGLRFFTVYGPWGRPDMAPMIFTEAIIQGKTINIFNNGDMLRDFTYIDDIVEGIVKLLDNIPLSKDIRPHEIYNIGCSNPIRLMDFIETLEKKIGLTSKKKFLPMQKGDVYQTYADVKKIEKEIGYKPSISLEEGISRFIDWYRIWDKNNSLNFFK